MPTIEKKNLIHTQKSKTSGKHRSYESHRGPWANCFSLMSLSSRPGVSIVLPLMILRLAVFTIDQSVAGALTRVLSSGLEIVLQEL